MLLLVFVSTVFVCSNEREPPIAGKGVVNHKKRLFMSAVPVQAHRPVAHVYSSRARN